MNKIFLVYFSPGNLLIISYKLTKFEALIIIVFRDMSILKISNSKFVNGNKLKKIKINFVTISPGNLLITLYQMTKFEAPSYNRF